MLAELGGCSTGAPKEGSSVIEQTKASNGEADTNAADETRFPATGPAYARYGAFIAAPAAGTASSSSVLDGFGHLLGGIGEAAGQMFAAQPLVATGLVVVGVGAGYMKVREDWGLGGRGGGSSEDGFAGKRELLQVLGRRQLVKKRKVLRPSLADVPARQVPANAVGVYLGQDRKTKLDLYMAIEDKRADGRADGRGQDREAGQLADRRARARARDQQQVRHRRADRVAARPDGPHQALEPAGHRRPDLGLRLGPGDRMRGPRGREADDGPGELPAQGSDATKGAENRNFWETASYRALKSFLWAADAAGLTLLDVARWCKQPSNLEAIGIFEKYADRAPYGWKEDLEQAQKVDGKPTTTENVFSTLAQTFTFLDDPQVQRMVLAAHDTTTPNFDIPASPASQDTLYLLGRDEGQGGVGPLFTALTGEIYETARAMASLQRGGRLDPPLTMDLDEAALICSVPLQRWTADSAAWASPSRPRSSPSPRSRSGGGSSPPAPSGRTARS